MWLQDKIGLGDTIICEDDPRHKANVVAIFFMQTAVGTGRSNEQFKVRWLDTGWVSYLTRDDGLQRV